MPIRQDVVVTNGGTFTPLGNGRGNLLRLDNGWLISLLNNTSTSFAHVYKSEDDGATWTELCKVHHTHNTVNMAVQSKGNTLYIITGISNVTDPNFACTVVDATTVAIGSTVNVTSMLGNEIRLQGCSLVINEAKTEIHVAWASINALYPTCNNIRYVKGTILTNGSVSWGWVEQVTKMPTDSYPNFYLSPSIALDSNDTPCIFMEQRDAVLEGTSRSGFGKYGITVIKKDRLLVTDNTFVNPSWSYKNLYAVSDGVQVTPTAIFVPKEFSNLPNGELFVAWASISSLGNKLNIRFCSSSDGGGTWSATKTVGTNTGFNKSNPTTTYSKGKYYVILQGSELADVDLSMFTVEANVPSALQTIKSGGTHSVPSALNDYRDTITKPLFVYRDHSMSRVAFSGIWAKIEMSVPQGNISTKTDKNNLLTYAITSDEALSTITEKINGVTVATKTATSGESLTVTLTDTQWNAIKFGKYADATGKLNTLTIEMAGDNWTYTFDKRLPTEADMLSAVKALQDSQTTYIPSVKARLASAIQGKGGTANAGDSFEQLISTLTNSASKRWATGVKADDLTALNFVLLNGSTSSQRTLTVTGLTFKPSLIVAMSEQGSGAIYSYIPDQYHRGGSTVKLFVTNNSYISTSSYAIKGDVAPVSVTSTGFIIPVIHTSAEFTWYAFE